MSPRPTHNLLNELLSRPELEQLRATTLDRGLAILRQRRRQRHLIRSAAIVVVLLGMLAMGWMLLKPQTASPLAARPPELPAARAMANSPPIAAPTSNVRMVSDQELLGLFSGRPVALIGPPGAQRLVLLDELR